MFARLLGAFDRILPDDDPSLCCTYTTGIPPEPLVNWPGERGITRCPGFIVGGGACDYCGKDAEQHKVAVD